jgi:hypothetical protein
MVFWGKNGFTEKSKKFLKKITFFPYELKKVVETLKKWKLSAVNKYN